MYPLQTHYDTEACWGAAIEIIHLEEEKSGKSIQLFLCPKNWFGKVLCWFGQL
jgi:hypothetical protein